MGYPAPKLTRGNQHQFFDIMVKHGDIFTYSMAFLLQDVEKLAEKYDYWIKYCGSGTDESKMHGSFVCYAYSKKLAAEEMIKNSEPTISEKWDEFNDRIGSLLKTFEEKKEEAGKIRDELRSIADEIEEIVDSFDDGVDGMDEAIRTFRDALDDMSRYV